MNAIFSCISLYPGHFCNSLSQHVFPLAASFRFFWCSENERKNFCFPSKNHSGDLKLKLTQPLIIGRQYFLENVVPKSLSFRGLIPKIRDKSLRAFGWYCRPPVKCMYGLLFGEISFMVVKLRYHNFWRTCFREDIEFIYHLRPLLSCHSLHSRGLGSMCYLQPAHVAKHGTGSEVDKKTCLGMTQVMAATKTFVVFRASLWRVSSKVFGQTQWSKKSNKHRKKFVEMWNLGGWYWRFLSVLFLFALFVIDDMWNFTFSVHYLSQTYVIHLGKLSRPLDLIQEVATVLAKYSKTLPFAQIYHIFTCTYTTFVIELDIEF